MKNIMSKKFTYMSFCIATVLVLIGCSGNDTNTQQNEENNVTQNQEGIVYDDGLAWDTIGQTYIMEDEILSGEVSLTVWVDNEEFGEAIVSGFKNKYPGVNVSYQTINTDDAVDQMALAGEAGLGADVFLLAHDQVGTAYNSSLLGMMGQYEEEINRRFLSSAVDTVEIDGILWGIPILTETIALFYNETLLNELYEEGVIDSPEPLTSFEEIIQFAYEFNDSSINKWALRFNTEEAYMNHMFLTAYGYQLFGENGDNPDMVGFDTPPTLQGLEFYQTLRPIWDVNSGDITWDVTVMEFALGETPYLISGPWAIEEVRKGSIENDFEFGVTTIPLIDNKQPRTFSGNQIIAVSPYSNYPAAARVLAMYIASDEMLTFLYQDLGKIPALNEQYTSNIEGLEDDEIIKGFMEQAIYTDPMPSIQEIVYFWTSAESMWRAVWDGLLTPEEAVEKAMDDYNTLREIGS